MLVGLLTLPGLVMASQTVYLSNPPTGLNLSAVPKTLPANGQTYNALVVTTVIGSTPAEELAALNLTLSSSNPGVISVPASAVIEPNADSAQIPLTTSTTAGSASITVSAPNLVTESITVSTSALANVPSGFGAVATPDKLFFDQNTTGMITLSLVNSAGLVVPASAPTQFTLTTDSANLSVSSQLTLSEGQSVASTGFQILSPGTYNLVINSSAMGSKTLTVSAVYYAPTTISAVMFPGILGVGLPSEIYLSLMNNNGVNTPPLSQVVFTITSSNVTIVSANGQTASLAPGALSTTIGVYPNAEGKATITVSAAGYPSVDIPVTVLPAGSTPSSMKITTSQPSFALITQASQGLGIELLNASGDPATTPNPVQVTLSPSSPTWDNSFPSSVTIPSGSYFVSTPVSTTSTSGSTTVTASAQNFQSASTMVISKGYVPTKLVITPLFSKGSIGVYQAAAALYLTDNNGLGYDSPAPMSVQGSVSGASASLLSPSISFQAGDDLLLSGINITSSGPSSITYTSSLGSAGYTISGGVVTGVLSISTPNIEPLVGQPYVIAISYVSSGSYVYNTGDITGQLASSSNAITPTVSFDMGPGASIVYAQFQPGAPGKVTFNTVASGYTSVGTTLDVASTPYTVSVSTPTIIYVGQTIKVYVGVEQNALPVPNLAISGSAAHGEKVACGQTNSTGYATCTYTGTGLSDTLTFSIKGVTVSAVVPITLINNGNTNHSPGPGSIAGPILGIAFIIAILIVVAWMFRHRHRSSGSTVTEDEIARLEEEANKAQPGTQPEAPPISPAFETVEKPSQGGADKLPLVSIDEEKEEPPEEPQQQP